MSGYGHSYSDGHHSSRYDGGGGGYGGHGYGGGGYGGGGYAAKRDLDSMQLGRPNFSGLPAFEKNFYVEHPAVAARSEEQVALYRKLREINVEGQGVPKPVTTFEEASFPGMSLLLKLSSFKSHCQA